MRKKVTIYFLLIALFSIPNLYAQISKQVIGTFPQMDGGFEGQAAGACPQATISSGATSNPWTVQTAGNGTLQTSPARTGGMAVNFYTTSTAKRLQSPTNPSTNGLQSTQYTVQYYYRTAGATGTAASMQVGISLAGTGSPVYAPSVSPYVSLAGTNGSWVKYSLQVTTNTTTPNSTVGIVRCNTPTMGVALDIDDFVIYQGATDNTAPDPVTGFSITGFGSSQLTLGWTAPGTGVDGGGYVVVRGLADPSTTPNANGIYAIGNTVATGEQVAYVGTSTSFTDNGLSPSTHYYYRVYTVDKAFNYSSATATDGSTTAASYAAEPTVQASNLSFANIGQTSIDINWTSGNGTNRLVLVKSGSAVNATPSDGSSYTASTTFSSGTQIGSGNYVVYNGTGSTVTVTGLTKATTYYVSIFEFNGSGGSENYLLTGAPAGGTATQPGIITSNATGVWSTGSTWVGGVAPTQSDSVIIANGHTVTVTATANCYSLNVQAGGKIYTNVALPTSSLVYTRVYGSSIRVDGTMGDQTDALAPDAFCIELFGTPTFTGTGIIKPGRIRPGSGTNNTSITFDADVTLQYTGSTGGGGAGFYTDNTADNCTFTVKTGRTVTLADYGNMSMASSTGTNGNASTVFNINGTLNMTGANSNFSLRTASAKTCTLNVAGALNIGNNFYASSASGGAVPVINVTGAGVITCNGPVDLSGATVVYGSGTFNLNSGATMTIGSANGLNNSTGPIRCSTQNYNANTNYNFTGTAAQVTGANFPSTAANVTINNANGVTVSAPFTVSNTLTLTSGALNNTSNNVTVNTTLAMTNAGSLTASPVYGGSAGLSYTGSSAQTSTDTEFPSSGGPFNLTVNNAAGVNLHASRTVNGTVLFSSGTLSTGANTLTLGSSATLSGEAAGKYLVGNLSLTAPLNGSYSNLAGTGVTINTNSNDLGSTVINRTSGTGGAVTVSGNTGINRKWKITPTNQPTSNVDLTFSWVSTDDNGKTLTDMYVWKSTDNGATWVSLAGPIDASARSLSFQTGSFSEFTLTDGASPLPVELTSFVSSVKGRTVTLKWETATEKNAASFDVERLSGSSWQKLASVKAAGNSSSSRSYSFSDNTLQPGTYQYRLKMIDNDGSFSYSRTIESVVDLPKEYSLQQNYPNPFNPSTRIEFQLPQNADVNIELFGISGEKVATLLHGTRSAGYHSVEVNAQTLGMQSGVYFYRVEAKDGIGGGFVQTRKMILTK